MLDGQSSGYTFETGDRDIEVEDLEENDANRDKSAKNSNQWALDGAIFVRVTNGAGLDGRQV